MKRFLLHFLCLVQKVKEILNMTQKKYGACELPFNLLTWKIALTLPIFKVNLLGKTKGCGIYCVEVVLILELEHF